MILEALVKTVEAIEPTVWVEALASRRIVNCSRFSASCVDQSSSASSSRLRPLERNAQTRNNVIIPMATTPPMTPPAMAPVFGFEPPDDGEGVLDELAGRSPFIQEVDGHAAQD